MSKETNPQANQNEEVDLGQLFKIIGKGFKNLFDFIASIFNGLFHLLILALAHFYKRAKWYAIAAVLGLVLGYFLQNYTETEYGANMFIETNFKSARQVYETMYEFNQLAGVDKDTLELAKRLNISVKEASSLKGFYVEPDIDIVTLMKDFVTYKYELDSVSRIDANFKDFTKERSKFNSKMHKIGVATTDKFIFEKIEKPLVSAFLDNDYINKLRETTLKNLDRQEAEIDEELKSLQSLLTMYTEIRKKTADKEFTPGAGTNFYMGNTEKTDIIKDETEVLEKMAELEAIKRQIAIKKVENEKQVNVISGFPVSGYEITEWYQNKILQIPAAFIVLLVLFFSFKGIGKFIEAQNA